MTTPKKPPPDPTEDTAGPRPVHEVQEIPGRRQDSHDFPMKERPAPDPATKRHKS